MFRTSRSDIAQVSTNFPIVGKYNTMSRLSRVYLTVLSHCLRVNQEQSAQARINSRESSLLLLRVVLRSASSNSQGFNSRSEMRERVL